MHVKSPIHFDGTTVWDVNMALVHLDENIHMKQTGYIHAVNK